MVLSRRVGGGGGSGGSRTGGVRGGRTCRGTMHCVRQGGPGADRRPSTGRRTAAHSCPAGPSPAPGCYGGCWTMDTTDSKAIWPG